MKPQSTCSTPSVPNVRSEQLCVVYHAKTGQIMHMHKITTLGKAKKPSEETIREKALEHAVTWAAKIRGHDRVQKLDLKTIHVDPKTYEMGTLYKVDLNTAKLVKLKTPKKPE
jgi:hypothetical protein